MTNEFHLEFDNDFKRFTVAGKTLLPGKLAPSVVGHVPRELSRCIWNAFRYVAIITSEVKDERPKRSPLVQNELEILIEMSNVMLFEIKKGKKRKTRSCSSRGLYRPKQQNSKRNEG